MTERRCRAERLARGARSGPASVALVLSAVALAAARLAAEPARTRLSAEAPARPAIAPVGIDVDASPAAAEPVPAGDPVVHWRPYVEEASRRFGVPAAWIERVIRAESGGRTTRNGRPIVSPAGAMGLMQLMPATWSALRAAHGLGGDPYDPRDNILAGSAYLASLYRQFGYPGLFGAYNAGPARYAAWLAGRASLPGETRTYLARVGADTASPGLFAGGENAAPADGTTPAPASQRIAAAVSGGHGGAAEAPGAAIRDRLFAVDRGAPLGVSTAVPAKSPAASEPLELPAGGLFVALSRPPSAAPED